MPLINYPVEKVSNFLDELVDVRDSYQQRVNLYNKLETHTQEDFEANLRYEAQLYRIDTMLKVFVEDVFETSANQIVLESRLKGK